MQNLEGQTKSIMVFLKVAYRIYTAHFLYGYIQMRFTTLCGGLCQTALWRTSQSF